MADDRTSTRPVTLMAAMAEHRERDGGATALIAPDGAIWTRDDLARRSLVWARTLDAQGVDATDRVALSRDPTLDTVAAYLGVLRLGASVVPVNTAYTDREIAHIAGDARPVAAIVDDAQRAVRWRQCGVPTVDAPPADAVPTSAPNMPPVDLAMPSDAALIGYTSGTTGAPKGAVLTHGNLLAGALSVATAWEWDANDRLVLALPLFHMHGLGVGINGTLVTGGSAVVLPSFDVDVVLDAIALQQATMFFGVPTMYARLSRSARLPELRALRVAVSGSAPLPPAVWQRIRDVTGVEVLERYGMTETVMLASNPLHGDRRPGSVGRPLPGVEMRLGEGDVVEVRGPNVFGGYLDRPEATAAAFTADAWFRTGDIGDIDADGYLTLVGRASELIISGGYNVYPREIEDVLRMHPLVRDVAVVGVQDDEWGEVVTAFVTTSDEALGADDGGVWSAPLEKHARTGLASFKVPRRWYRVEALPRNAMGKVVRHELRPPASS